MVWLFYFGFVISPIYGNSLSNITFIVVLDAGHGGHDSGNRGNGYFEKTIALKIALSIGNILEKYDCVYGTYGIHPHEAKKHLEIKSNHIISQVKKSKKIIGIGESGLDFYYNHSEKKRSNFILLRTYRCVSKNKLTFNRSYKIC